MRVFVSSTYSDLIDHRAALNNVLQRMKVQFASMEYFGSRADEALPACRKEIEHCDVLVGIYAWRYGWQSSESSVSITEEEFDYARHLGKRCLCYLIDEKHPWPPTLMDETPSAERLRKFKSKVSVLVKSCFTTPENLAMQVAADLARELVPDPPDGSFGGLLRLNWEIFSAEMQVVLSTAYAQARVESNDGVVATRHVVAALVDLPNTARPLVTAFPGVPLPRLELNLQTPEIAELFAYDQPISSCVLGSMERLLPMHSPAQRLLAIELATDLLKHGTGTSVADYRKAGVDSAAVDRMLTHIRRTAANKYILLRAFEELTDAEVIHLAYVADVAIPEHVEARLLRSSLLATGDASHKTLVLVGELMRRYPRLLEFGGTSQSGLSLMMI